MKSLNGLGLGLSIVFGCLLLALVAELYYLLWWKRRITTNTEFQDDCISPSRELLLMFCWKNPASLSSTDTQVHEPQAQLENRNSNGELWLKPFVEEDEEDGNVEAELLRLQSLSGGPPRFLFTIKEETKEDLESEANRSRKGSKGRSLSDVSVAVEMEVVVETPYMTPMSSPPYYTPPLTPIDIAYTHREFNPLFRSSSDAEFNRMRSSPPPKFKFLRDAEEKLNRKNMAETIEHGGCVQEVQVPSSSSQVLPLAASPPTLDRNLARNSF